MLQGPRHVRHEGLPEERDDWNVVKQESDGDRGSAHGNDRPTLELSPRAANYAASLGPMPG